MAHVQLHSTRTAIAAAALCASFAGQAADTTITVTGRGEAGSALSGFGELPLARSPLQALTFGSERLADAGATRIGDLVRLDASVADAYNAPGYWSIVSVRGFTLDNRFNYRRDGLPINAETAIALDNKDRLELLKGTSGIQAGTSAPGGLVNLIVKRPVAGQRSASIGWRESGTLGAAVDIGDRVGPDGAIGWRVNTAVERLDPKVRDSQGRRSLFALATDWQLGADTLLEAEVESSRQRQPSVAGFSMLGDTVPDANDIDPRINLNSQPWNKPVVLNGDTASLRWQQRFSDDWTLRVHAMARRLKSDDRTAFPYGCYDAVNDIYYGDRFCPNGDFDLYDYRSDDEHRRSDAFDTHLVGTLVTGAVRHRLTAGLLLTRFESRFQDQAFNYAGPDNVFVPTTTSPAPDLTEANTNRNERSTEVYLRDAMQWDAWSLWAGLRHTRLQRDSVRTSPDSDDSLRATSYSQSLTTPWLALAQQLTPQTMLYASWGRGLESDVAPNRPRFINAGQALPALKSRQVEAGVKHAGESLDASLTLFDIDRPRAANLGACDAADTCTRTIDGSTRHRGVEAAVALRAGAWTWQTSAMLLQAENRGSSQDGVNGTRPANVPRATLRLAGAYRVLAVPGLELDAAMSAESDRVVLPDDTSVRIPGWARVDIGARWTHRLDGGTLTWRAGIDNLADRRAWVESPYQFDHVYLYPLSPRTVRASAELAF